MTPFDYLSKEIGEPTESRTRINRLKVGCTNHCAMGPLVNRIGFEPMTQGLRVPCSTAELPVQ